MTSPLTGRPLTGRPLTGRPLTGRPRVLCIVTHAKSARLLMRGQLAWMRAAGFEVAVAASPGPDLDAVAARENVETIAVPMAREIDPWADLAALRALVGVMRRWRPDVVNAGTPKAGLLGMLAARVAGVPARIYTLRGLRLETTRGAKRALLTTTERLAAAAATHVVSVSQSLGARYVALGLAPARKVVVLGQGSSNGVDAARFAHADPARIAALRATLGLPETDPVIGFVGRFTRDKGLEELARAFEALAATHPSLRLLLVGDFEDGDPLPHETRALLCTHPRIHRAGFVADAAPYFHLMDVLAFPSYREGFPNVVLEAAAAGLPVVGTCATGVVDAVVDGRTGVLVPVGDADALRDALARYLADGALRAAHGEEGKNRVRRDFQPEHVWAALAQLYRAAPGRPGSASAGLMGLPLAGRKALARPGSGLARSFWSRWALFRSSSAQ
ncbi:MAG: glycosyltransferase family 4 protein [Rubricoccaceae bacterium]